MSELDEALEAELGSLEAILGADFQRLPVQKNAWGQAAPPSIRIFIYCTEADVHSRFNVEAAGLPSVVLQVEFSPSYPRTSPQTIRLLNAKAMKAQDVVTLEASLKEAANRLQGTEMVYDLVLLIKDTLPSFIQVKDPAASLEEERKLRLQSQNLKAEMDEHNEAARRQTEEQRQANELRLKLRSADGKPSSQIAPAPVLVYPTEQHFLNLTKRAYYKQFAFDSVGLGVPLGQDSLVHVYLTHIANGDNLIVKKFELQSERFDAQEFRESVSRIESHIRQSLQQHTVSDDLSVHNIGYHVEHSRGVCKFYILQPHLGLSAADLLHVVHPDTKQCRRWLIDLVECLASIHRQGRLHGRIKASKIFFIHEGDEQRATLLDVGYLADPVQGHMRLPALISNTRFRGVLQGKSEDLARLVLAFVQLCTGNGSYASFETLEKYLTSIRGQLPPEAFDFALEALTGELSRRLTSADLLNTPFLRGANLVKEESVSSAPDRPFLLTRQATVIPSRYMTDFDELAKLGQGGFGSVYKARNRLDGRLYAIKKISNFRENNRLLREVSGLARLNHIHIVRYFSAWLEEDGRSVESCNDEFSLSASFSDLPSSPADDFMSSSGLIEFARDKAGSVSRSLSDISEKSASNHSVTPSASASVLNTTVKTLYLQMEYCPQSTLRDLIDHKDIGLKHWHYFGQIAQAICYLHSEGLIHRDLKPANIFVSAEGLLKLGDFGLATESQVTDAVRTVVRGPVEQTTEVGTFLYSAPEVQNPSLSYDAKVDIYAMGIMLAEMVCDWATSMERVQLLRSLRQDPLFPAIDAHDKPLEARLVSSMLQHDSKMRPSAAELTELLPPLVERDQIAAVLRLIDQDEVSKAQVVSKLFSQRPKPIADYLYGKEATAIDLEADLRTTETVSQLTGIFRAHGALPRSNPALLLAQPMYASKRNAVRLLDPSGQLVQMPFDLSLPWARRLARNPGNAHKSFTIGTVARVDSPSSSPRVLLEADFDIATTNGDPALAFAEVIQTALEIASMDCFQPFKVRLVMGHSAILAFLLGTTNLTIEQRGRLAPLIVQLSRRVSTWQPSKIRRTLADEDLSDTLVQDLHSLILAWPMDSDILHGLNKLRQAFGGRLSTTCLSAIASLEYLASELDQLGLKLEFDPFSGDGTDYYSVNFRLDYGKGAQIETLCQGGLYQESAARLAMPGETMEYKTIAGFSLAVDKVSRLRKLSKTSGSCHCFVLFAYSQLSNKSSLFEMLRALWKLGIPTDHIQLDSTSTDDAAEVAKKKGAHYVVLFREKRNQAHLVNLLKVRNVVTKEQSDVLSADMPSFLQQLYLASKGEVEQDSRTQVQAGSREKPDVHFITEDEHRKMKLPQRHFIAGKAIEALDGLSKRLQGGQAVILVVEFDEEQLSTFQSMRVLEDASNRRILDRFDAHSRVQAANALGKLEHLAKTSGKAVLMYSFRTGRLVLLHTDSTSTA